jgi:hypothetical protein
MNPLAVEIQLGNFPGQIIHQLNVLAFGSLPGEQ